MKASEIAEFIGGELIGSDEAEASSVADITRAVKGQASFYDRSGPLPPTAASVVILSADDPPEQTIADDTAHIVVRNPKLEFARLAALLHPAEHRGPGIHPDAAIAEDAVLGEGVFAGAFCSVGTGSAVGDGTHLLEGAKIGSGVSIGKYCVIHPNVVIYDGCSIGDNVILHAGVVVGADGFGFVKGVDGEYVKFPQIGTVVIENDVEIGANTCIDRGALGLTRIGAGTKIDNLVQVGHNVDIGQRCVIASQTGISGSVVIEDDCIIGGQVGFGDHVRVLSGAVIGSQAGVLPGKKVRPGVWWGTPIQPLDDYKRQNAHVKGLARLKEEIKELKRSLGKD